MSSSPYIIGSMWGLPRRFWRRPRDCEIAPPHLNDSPEGCRLGPTWWNSYPIKDYTYRYNSWGFRDDEWEQHQGKPVNICIGDSMTLNIGGPIEHSWPYQLGQFFDIPTINLGIDQLPYTLFPSMYERAFEFFKVEKVFVLLNLFTMEDIADSRNIVRVPVDLDTRIKVLKDFCWIPGAYWQFDPPWVFDSTELKALYEYFPTAHDYLKDYNFQSLNKLGANWSHSLLFNTELRDLYQELKGNDWISYNDFCEVIMSGANVRQHFTNKIDQQLVDTILHKTMFSNMKNRDGYHMNHHANKALADYFIGQVRA